MSYVRGAGTAARGMGYSVNDTTIFEPGTGAGSGFLSTPGNPATASGGAAVYQTPAYTPPPACSSSPDPNTSDSPACIALLLQTQQSNMQLSNNANYTVDESDCVSNLALNNAQRAGEGLAPLPNTCGSNTFDLVPTGGYTGDGSVSGPQTIVDANNNPVSITPAAVSGPTPNPYTAPVFTTPSPSLVSSGTLPGSTGGGIVSAGSSFFGSDVDIAGEEIPVWGLIAAGVALLLLVRH